MTADAHPWTVRLTKTAESDYQSIIVWTLIVWTLREFGDQQARIYADALSAALVALTAEPTTLHTLGSIPGPRHKIDGLRAGLTLRWNKQN